MVTTSSSKKIRKLRSLSDAPPHIPSNNPPDNKDIEVSVPFESAGIPLISNTSFEQIDIRDVPLENLDKMLRVDGQAAAMWNVITLPIKAMAKNFYVEPTSGGKREANWINDVFRKSAAEGGMQTTFMDVISQQCVAFLHGFKVFEKVWDVDNKGFIYPRKVAGRQPYRLNIKANKQGEFDGFIQRVTFRGEFITADIPVEKATLFNYNGERNPLYGVSAFLPAYYHYDKKHKLYYIANIAHQINAIAARIGKVPRGTTKEKKTALLSALSALQFNAAIVMEDIYEIDQFPKNGGRVANYMDLIHHHNVSMSKSVVAHFMDLGVEGGSGSWALSKNDFDLFMMATHTAGEAAADMWNIYIIPQLIDWNFGTGKYPKLFFKKLTDDQKNLLKDVFYKVVVDTAPNVSDEFMYQIEKEMAHELALPLEYTDDTTNRNVPYDPKNYNKPMIRETFTSPISGSPTGDRNIPPTRNRSGVQQPKDQNVPSPSLEDLGQQITRLELSLENLHRGLKKVSG